MAREMKDSGIEWIGEIPKEWDKNKTFRLFSIIGSGTTPKATDDNVFSGEIPWLQSGDINGGTLVACKNSISEVILNQYSALKLFNAPFIVIAMYGASIGNMSISLINGCVNQACCVFSDTMQDLQYMFYTIKSAQKYLIQKGVGGGQANISQEILKQLWVPVPPVIEQQRIASFLDAKCTEIDAVLEKTRSSIEEYKKLKQSIITQAVTKGIRPNRPMKDSGVEWIGEVVKEWDCAKLKYFASLRAGITLGKAYPSDATLVETPYLRVANVQGSFVDLTDVATLSVYPEEVEKYRLHKGEVLMTEGGDRDKLGRGCVWNGELDPCLHQNHVFAVTTNSEKLLGQYLAYMTASNIARTYFDVTAKKTTNLACTNSTTILNFTMPIPSIKEQEEIIEYLDRKCADVDTLIAKKEQFISALETYKKSLIYEYVTGKKEVPAQWQSM